VHTCLLQHCSQSPNYGISPGTCQQKNKENVAPIQIMSIAGEMIELKVIMLSEISQPEKDK
jgi:hypothetical protein